MTTGGWRLDEEAVAALRAGVARGDADIIDLLGQAAARAAETDPDRPPEALSAINERRLGDRILAALEMALDQDDLEVSEHLELAFEAAMTRFGGPDKVENRDIPDGMLRAYERLDDLRRRRYRL